MTSPIYWHPYLYHIVMRLLYGRGFRDRYTAMALRIPNGASVVELCAGDCMLYRKFLKGKDLTYTATDINPVFIAAAKKRGISAKRLDVMNDPIPHADIVIMQASLYQFMPHEKAIVDKMLAAARSRVLIAEPIRNLSDSRNPLIALIARGSTNPGTGQKTTRFNRQTITAFFRENYRDKTIEILTTAGEREMLVVLDVSVKQ